ncbi:MAG: hypothetical protein WBO77_04240 [Microgenomates group bacterium]
MTNLSSTIKQDLAEFNKLDQNRKMAVIAIIFGLFIISIIVGANVTKKSDTDTQTATPTTGALENAKPSTTIALSPAKQTIKVGEATKIDVMLSKLPVTAADVILTYDAKQVTVSALTNGTVFPRVIGMKNETGKITYNGSLSEESPTDRKEGVIFSFTVTPKAGAKSVVIDFDHTKTLTAINGENTLGSTVGGIYTIQ